MSDAKSICKLELKGVHKRKITTHDIKKFIVFCGIC